MVPVNTAARPRTLPVPVGADHRAPLALRPARLDLDQDLAVGKAFLDFPDDVMAQGVPFLDRKPLGHNQVHVDLPDMPRFAGPELVVVEDPVPIAGDDVVDNTAYTCSTTTTNRWPPVKG